MNKIVYDIIVVGTGPAAISFLSSIKNIKKKSVLVIDSANADDNPDINNFKENYLDIRANDNFQFDKFIGRSVSFVEPNIKISPKFLLDKYSKINPENLDIKTNNFSYISASTLGGLSSIWGSGIAMYDKNELKQFDYSNFDLPYKEVLNLIGFSGYADDDLIDYIGKFGDSNITNDLDPLSKNLFDQYSNEKFSSSSFLLGRSRLAVLHKNKSKFRMSCNNCGNCYWGCSRGSIFNSKYKFFELLSVNFFKFIDKIEVNYISKTNSGHLCVNSKNTDLKFTAKKVFLAAGTIQSSIITLRSINAYQDKLINKICFQSTPTAAFMLFKPSFLKQSISNNFALSNLSYKLAIDSDINAFGNTFTSSSLPRSDLAKHLPFGYKSNMTLLKHILPSTLLCNLFLPGKLSNHSIKVNSDKFILSSASDDHLLKYFHKAKKKLRFFFKKLGFYVVPGSFQISLPGSDVHYAATFPMSKKKDLGFTNFDGEVFGFENLHIIDGSILPYLSEKPHTLTIMANAYRIGNNIYKKSI
jgi:hypothetical protein